MATDPNALQLLQGKTFRVTFIYGGPTPISLAGWGARFVLVDRKGAVLVSVDDTVLDPGDEESAVIIEANNQTGHVDVRLGADQTATLNAKCHYDAVIYKKTDLTEVQPLAAGPMYVVPVGDEPDPTIP